MALRNQPYLPLYVQDFLTDEKLMECSSSATGIYIKVMCIMHKSDEYGTILLKQKDKQTDNQISNFAIKLVKYLPFPLNEIISGLTELVNEGVIQIEDNKLMQKRMIQDNELSIIRAKSGSKGGFAKANNIAKDIAKDIANTEDENEDENININNKGTANFKKSTAKITAFPFDEFWELYDKKVDRKKIEPKWAKITEAEREQIKLHVPMYVKSTPDKIYRKNPEAYLNARAWENEIIINEDPIIKNGCTVVAYKLKPTDDEEFKEYRPKRNIG